MVLNIHALKKPYLLPQSIPIHTFFHTDFALITFTTSHITYGHKISIHDLSTKIDQGKSSHRYEKLYKQNINFSHQTI